MVLSSTDPWLSPEAGRRRSERWGCSCVHLGDVGHINVEAGFATLPFARRWVAAMGQRLEREQRIRRASIAEWAFAV